MLKTGTVITERYEILTKIGTGGMADVYKAKDQKLNRFVAVKVLKPEFREDRTFIRKFKSEAQAAAGLTHPNIVNVFDVGDDEGVYYIVMELIEGITLKDYISKKGKLSIKEATSIAIQVSMGLEAAHSHGIVHRDVKPQNIIISTDGKVKVTDFGIARAASSNTISSNVMGSVHYSSPEQVRGGYSDEKSDIYSLGITIYEMITGRVPFDGDTTVAIAIKHLQEEMVPPSAYAPEIPYSLEQIIYKCTQKSVDRRYQNMGDVIADLKHSLIDPQGDFVKLQDPETEGKTRVISDDEIGEIKKTASQTKKNETPPAEKSPVPRKNKKRSQKGNRVQPVKNMTPPAQNVPDNTVVQEKEAVKNQKVKKKKKRRSVSRVIPIILLILGAAFLIGLIVYFVREAGLIGETQETREEVRTEETAAVETEALTVPNLIGMTEAEAQTAASGVHLGIQYVGQEPSVQDRNLISRTVPAAGTPVEENSTVEYYLSTGSPNVTMPDLSQKTGIEAEQILKDMGLFVTVEKQYSEQDDEGYALVEPGYVYATIPATDSVVQAGDNVTLIVSRGADYGSTAEVPDVVGQSKNAALTYLGKWIDIRIQEEQSTEIPEDQVIAQSLEPGTSADPNLPITLTISCGEHTPRENAYSASGNAAAADGVWKCTQRLNTPEGYQGGVVRLELVQEVNGQPRAQTIVDGEYLEFPYQLDLTGEPGVATGLLYLYEMTEDEYEELGHYTITFERQA